MNQPDFTKIFFDFFGGKPRKVSYRLRFPPHFLHDLAFMSSLVHDAGFFRKDLQLKGQKLTILLNRDCWEIPKTLKNELHVTKSRLSFSSVKDLRWMFQGNGHTNPDAELFIDGFCINESFRSQFNNRFDFIICGHDWQLRFTLKQFNFIARLEDLEVPHLFSKKEHSLSKPLTSCSRG